VLAQKYHLAENAPWLAAYYPLHLARLFVRQTGRLWRLLRRDPETIKWAAEQAAQKKQSALETWMLGL
jgi:hypothetical protein